jgi:uncharacterized membrane protein
MPTPHLRFRWLLPASLTLNVFLGAALFAHLRTDWTHRPPPPPSDMLEQMTRSLPVEDAQILRQSLASSINEIEMAHRAEEGLPQHLQAILGKEPFDKKAFKDLLEQSQHARDSLNEALPEAIERLSPEGRRRLAEWRPTPPSGPREGPPPAPPPRP